MPRLSHNTGFALLDTLVALVLFAMMVLGAIAVLLQGMRATHTAVLTGRAVDLAADFLEQRRAQSSGEALDPLLTAWNERLHTDLPPGSQDTATSLIEPLLTAAAGDAP